MEHIKNLIAWEVLLIILFASLLVIDSVDRNGLSVATGRVTHGALTQDSIREELEEAVPKLDFLKDIDETTLCIIVNIDEATAYSYEIVKIGETTVVTNSDNLVCKGVFNEDFIVSYRSYDKLKEHIDDVPSFQELKETSDGTNFYVLPSKQILSGSTAADPAELNSKYGTILKKYFGKQEVNQILKPETRKAGPSALSYIFYVILGAVILVIIISFSVVKLSKKPEIKEGLELTSYIKSTISQGYEEAEIKQSLLDNGWSEEDVQKAFESAKSEVSEPPGFT